MRMKRKHRGSVIVMVTLGLVAMFGVMSLAVDLGWGFYVRKSARAAADAAVLAAAKRAFATIGSVGPFICTTTGCSSGGACMECQASFTDCNSISADSNLYNGCRYAEKHGFAINGSNPRQAVRMMATDSTTTPTFETGTGPIDVQYVVTAVVVEQVPQLFSRIFGNTDGTVAARSSAALLKSKSDASLIILDRYDDPVYFGNSPSYGLGVELGGGGAVQVTGRTIIASDCHGVTTGAEVCRGSGNYSGGLHAGESQGGSYLDSTPNDITFYGAGWYDPGGSSQWLPQPVRQGGPIVLDPMAGRGQPPVPAGYGSWREIAVGNANGDLDTTTIDLNTGTVVCPAGVCPAGRYYAVDPTSGDPTGAPIRFSGTLTLGSSSAFNYFVFYGGIASPGGGATVNINSGMYILAGVIAPNANNPGVVFDTRTNFTIDDGGPYDAKNTNYVGQLFVLTNMTYSGNMIPPAALTGAGFRDEFMDPAHTTPRQRYLGFGAADLQAGNNGTYLNLHGLNPALTASVDTDLANFIDKAALLLWWDQNNSNVKYYDVGVEAPPSGGAANYPCGDPNQWKSGSKDNCLYSPPKDKTPQLTFGSSPSTHVYGVIYQPRGAWTWLNASPGYTGPVQLITGALKVHATSTVSLGLPLDPVVNTIVALVQ